MHIRLHNSNSPNLPERSDTYFRGLWLILCVGLLLISPHVLAADIVDIKQSIITLRSDTIATIPGSSQRKLLKNLNNALGSLENASTMIEVGKRTTGIEYFSRAGEYMENYLRRLNKLAGRGDILEATAQPLREDTQRIIKLLRD
jgi:hypothetical protein